MKKHDQNRWGVATKQFRRNCGQLFHWGAGGQFLNIPACQEDLSAVKIAQIIVLEEQYMLSCSFVTLQLAFCKKVAACTYQKSYVGREL